MPGQRVLVRDDCEEQLPRLKAAHRLSTCIRTEGGVAVDFGGPL
jgi:hypothetical protein